MRRSLLSLGRAVSLAAICLAGASMAATSQEKKKPQQLSEHTVSVIMSLAFAGMPGEVQKPDGKVVKLDRSDPKKFIIPVEHARAVIVQSVLISRAELCELADLKKELFNKMMAHQAKTNKWSSEQLVYVQLLSVTTETFMTGQQAVGDESKKAEDPNQDIKEKYKCSADEKARVKESVQKSIEQLALAQ